MVDEERKALESLLRQVCEAQDLLSHAKILQKDVEASEADVDSAIYSVVSFVRMIIPTKVFLVTSGEHDLFTVHEIFDNKEMAESWQKENQQLLSWANPEFEIHEYKLWRAT